MVVVVARIRLKESMMGLRPRQRTLRQAFFFFFLSFFFFFFFLDFYQSSRLQYLLISTEINICKAIFVSDS